MIWRFGIAVVLAAALSLFALNAPHAQFNGCQAGFCSPPRSCSPVSPPAGGIFDSTNLSGSGPTGGALVTSNVTSPDCTVDASTFTEDSSTGQHLILPNNGEITHTFAAASATVTLYFKRGSGTRNELLTMFNSGFSAQTNVIINPATCAIAQVAFTSFAAATATATPTAVGTFCKTTLNTSTVTDTGVWIEAASCTGATGASCSYAGDGASTMIYWGLGLTTP